MSSSTSKTLAITPRRTMRGHTERVNSVVHLPDRRRIVTCSSDGSLRLWDLESGIQIGEDWRDGNHAVGSIALSPDGKIIASGGADGKVRLWDVETRKVIANWMGHTYYVWALCWSADGERLATGTLDEMARVWDVDKKKIILTIKTGDKWVRVVMYSPDSSKLVTGGDNDNTVKIWDAKTGELLNTLKHDGRTVHGLAWTSDGKKLISGSYRLIRLFDTATWQQIAILDTHRVTAISLSPNNRLLASASWDNTARLWNLDTNLPVGPPLQHEDHLLSVALSLDGKVLVTTCKNKNAYAWDVHAILKKVGLEDLLPSDPNVLTRKPLVNSNATRHPPVRAHRTLQGFLDGVQNNVQSSATRGTHSRSSPTQHPRSTRAPLFDRLLSLLRQSRFDTDEGIELQQRPTRSTSSRGPPTIEVPTVQDRKSLFVVPRPGHSEAKQTQQQQAQSHSQGLSTTPHTPGTNAAAPGARPARSRLVQFLSHLVLFLCCASPQRAGGNAQSTQQQPQVQVQTYATSSQSESQIHVSSPQTQPTVPSTSTTPIALHTTAPSATSRQPRPLPLRTRFILFLCCTSLPHADEH